MVTNKKNFGNYKKNYGSKVACKDVAHIINRLRHDFGVQEKKSKQWMIKGGYKYLLQLLHRLIREVLELRKTQRYMIQGLEHEFLFDTEYVLAISCKDEVDQAIIDILRSAGAEGRLPKDIASDLKNHKLKPWNVTQRIRRMNKRLDRHLAKHVAEKRGLKWALTSWTCQNLGATKEET